ncbi:MAG: hypothetical protein AAF533_08695 [Acidobacteriota bacterium]
MTWRDKAQYEERRHAIEAELKNIIRTVRDRSKAEPGRRRKLYKHWRPIIREQLDALGKRTWPGGMLRAGHVLTEYETKDRHTWVVHARADKERGWWVSLVFSEHYGDFEATLETHPDLFEVQGAVVSVDDGALTASLAEWEKQGPASLEPTPETAVIASPTIDLAFDGSSANISAPAARAKETSAPEPEPETTPEREDSADETPPEEAEPEPEPVPVLPESASSPVREVSLQAVPLVARENRLLDDTGTYGPDADEGTGEAKAEAKVEETPSPEPVEEPVTEASPADAIESMDAEPEPEPAPEPDEEIEPAPPGMAALPSARRAVGAPPTPLVTRDGKEQGGDGPTEKCELCNGQGFTRSEPDENGEAYATRCAPCHGTGQITATA